MEIKLASTLRAKSSQFPLEIPEHVISIPLCIFVRNFLNSRGPSVSIKIMGEVLVRQFKALSFYLALIYSVRSSVSSSKLFYDFLSTLNVPRRTITVVCLLSSGNQPLESKLLRYLRSSVITADIEASEISPSHPIKERKRVTGTGERCAFMSSQFF